MRQVNHMTKFLWQNRLMILAATLLFAVSAVYWRDYWENVNSRMASQVEYEDAALCTKFGFVAGASGGKHKSCMSDLHDLRVSHEEMIAAASMP
jgi:hypothetical protein